jgi:hypothetical protein
MSDAGGFLPASRVGEQPVGINGDHPRQIGDHHVSADQSRAEIKV